MVSPTLDPASERRLPSGSEIRLLIVDDESGNREAMEDCGRALGYQITSAASGQQALEAAERWFYHVAILDIRLPDMFGTDLLAQLKALQPHLECVMITGYASLQSAMSALNNGAAAFLTKPLNVEHLWCVVQQVVDRQQQVFEQRRLLSECRDRIRELEGREAELLEQLRRRGEV